MAVTHAVERRPWKPDEIAVIEALEGCSFPAAHPHKRFVRDIAFACRHSREIGLTERQAQYLLTIGHRYRRQLPAAVKRLVEPKADATFESRLRVRACPKV